MGVSQSLSQLVTFFHEGLDFTMQEKYRLKTIEYLINGFFSFEISRQKRSYSFFAGILTLNDNVKYH